MYKPVKDTFLYFAYGSNLLKRRIHINNPSAEFLGIGKLDVEEFGGALPLSNFPFIISNFFKDHQLDFMKYSDHWRGTSATIVPTPNLHIWGAIWRLHNNDIAALDKQEGVDTNWYFPKTVNILTEEGTNVECRTYQQTLNPPVRGTNEQLPCERRPSITYLNCIIQGAIECNLPKEYINELKKIPHNGQEASPKMIEKLKM